MIPHTQTNTNVPGGDCFRTCIASILEVPVDHIPNHIEDDDWYDKFNDICGKYGYRLITLVNTSRKTWSYIVDGCWCIAQGTSIRGVRHCCIAKGSEIVHDPHPSRAGLEKIYGYVVFVATDPQNHNYPHANKTT